MTSQHDAPPEPPKRPRWTFAAIALFVLGLLILVPSGLCTGTIGILALFDPQTDWAEFMVLILPIGGVPIAIGAALVYGGLKARRRD